MNKIKYSIKRLALVLVVLFGQLPYLPAEASSDRAPVMGIIGNQTIEETTLLKIYPQVSDVDYDPINISVENLPQGASFNTETKLFSWTPTESQAGNYQVTFVANDSPRVSETIDIKVENIIPPGERETSGDPPVTNWLNSYAKVKAGTYEAMMPIKDGALDNAGTSGEIYDDNDDLDRDVTGLSNFIGKWRGEHPDIGAHETGRGHVWFGPRDSTDFLAYGLADEWEVVPTTVREDGAVLLPGNITNLGAEDEMDYNDYRITVTKYDDDGTPVGYIQVFFDQMSDYLRWGEYSNYLDVAEGTYIAGEEDNPVEFREGLGAIIKTDGDIATVYAARVDQEGILKIEGKFADSDIEELQDDIFTFIRSMYYPSYLADLKNSTPEKDLDLVYAPSHIFNEVGTMVPRIEADAKTTISQLTGDSTTTSAEIILHIAGDREGFQRDENDFIVFYRDDNGDPVLRDGNGDVIIPLDDKGKSLGFSPVVTLENPNVASASARYKRSDETVWREALDLFRIDFSTSNDAFIRANQDIDNRGGTIAKDNKLSGSIFDLAPGTSYDVEITVTDDDGLLDAGGNSLGNTQVITTSFITRSIPKVPKPGTFISLEGGGINTTQEYTANPSNITSVIADLKPGDILRLEAGDYGNIQIPDYINGTFNHPILITAADPENRPILTGVNVAGGDHIWLDNLYVQVKDQAVDGGLQASSDKFVEGAVTTRVRSTGDWYNYSASGSGFYVVDSSFEHDDDSSGPSKEGIQFNGPSHTASHNYIKETADGISLGSDSRNTDLFFNIFDECWDDDLEPDRAWGNVRGIGNLMKHIRNYGSSFSFQPVYGGPLFYAGNQVSGETKNPWKMRSGWGAYNFANNTVSYNLTPIKSYMLYDNNAISVNNFYSIYAPDHLTDANVLFSGGDPSAKPVMRALAHNAYDATHTIGLVGYNTPREAQVNGMEYGSFLLATDRNIGDDDGGDDDGPPANKVPVAEAKSLLIEEDESVLIQLTGSDADGDRIVFALVNESESDKPANGFLRDFNPDQGTVTYTPNPNYKGEDSFKFRVSDGESISDPVAVRLNIVTPANVNSAGVVGNWLFDSVDFGMVSDETSFNNDGSLVDNPSFSSEGRIGGALEFDGTDDAISVPHDASLNLDADSGMSIALWTKTATDAANTRGFVTKNNQKQYGVAPANTTYEFGVRSHDIYFKISDGTQNSIVSGRLISDFPGGLKDDKWHHLAATWDGTTNPDGMKIYVDGIVKYVGTSTISSIQTRDWDLDIGGGGAGSAPFKGALDEVVLYNRMLIGGEVLSLATGGRVQYNLSNNAPTANFNYDPNSGIKTSTVVEFDGSISTDTDGGIAHYAWDFNNDGNIDATTMKPSFSFATEGSHNVKLTVKDNGGLTHSVTKTLTVSNSNASPTAAFSYTPPTGILTTTDVSLNAGASSDSDGSIASYAWDFNGDGDTDATGVNASHKFNTAGNHNVSLTVTDNEGATNKVTKTIIVSAPNNPPVASFSYTPATGILTTTDVSFNASASSDSDGSIAAYAWDFNNDGRVDATTVNPSHKFTAAGNHVVALTVTDDDGAINSISKTIVVALPNNPPTAAFSYTPPTGVLTTTDVNFNASASSDSDGSIASYAWDFNNDGSTDAVTVNPSYKFITPGNHNITLTVTDNDGATNSIVKTVVVALPNNPPVAAFNYTPSSGILTTSNVNFNAGASRDSDGSIAAYAWDFNGDGNIDATTVDPSHKFTSAGNHTVQLTVTDNDGATNTISKTVVVALPNNPPVAAFSYTPTTGILTTTDVSLNAGASSDSDGSIASYAWDFNGDGNIDKTGVNPSHKFGTAGNHNVTLTVTDDDGATNSLTKTIVVTLPNNPPVAAFNYAPTADIDTSTNVSFDARFSNDVDGSITNYAWDFNGDGDTDATGVNASHKFRTAGNHNVILTVTDDDGATNSLTKTVVVDSTNKPPQAAFNFRPSVGILTNTSIAFDASASKDEDGRIVNYAWDFNGDGNTDATSASVSHKFIVAGNHNVTLTVTDNDGAINSITRIVSVESRDNEKEDNDNKQGDNSGADTGSKNNDEDLDGDETEDDEIIDIASRCPNTVFKSENIDVNIFTKIDKNSDCDISDREVVEALKELRQTNITSNVSSSYENIMSENENSEQIKVAFSFVDTNSDGEITHQEAFKAHINKQINRAILKNQQQTTKSKNNELNTYIDVNKDGVFNQEDESIIDGITNTIEEDSKSLEERVIEFVDRDNNQIITKRELRKSVKHLKRVRKLYKRLLRAKKMKEAKKQRFIELVSHADLSLNFLSNPITAPEFVGIVKQHRKKNR